MLRKQQSRSLVRLRPKEKIAMVENRKRLFVASFMTLIVAGLFFGLRASILGDWATQFGFTKSELGGITGGGFVGFGVVI